MRVEEPERLHTGALRDIAVCIYCQVECWLGTPARVVLMWAPDLCWLASPAAADCQPGSLCRGCEEEE